MLFIILLSISSFIPTVLICLREHNEVVHLCKLCLNQYELLENNEQSNQQSIDDSKQLNAGEQYVEISFATVQQNPCDRNQCTIRWLVSLGVNNIKNMNERTLTNYLHMYRDMYVISILICKLSFQSHKRMPIFLDSLWISISPPASMQVLLSFYQYFSNITIVSVTSMGRISGKC